MSKSREYIIVAVIASVLLLPFAFLIFRITAFGTMPFDDYYSPILRIDNKLPGFEPWSPTCYRFGYIYTGYLFYKIFPLIELSQMPFESKGSDYLKAIQGLSLASFGYLYLFILLTYIYVRQFLEKNIIHAIAVAGIVFFLSLNTAFWGADTMYLFYSLLLLISFPNWKAFPFLMLASPLVNEKIPLFFFLFFVLSLLFGQRDKQVIRGMIFSMLAIGIYFLIRTSLNYPGYEYQTKFSEFFTRFGSAWNYAMTAKGAFFTFFPTLLLLGLIYWAFRQKAFSSKEIQYSRSIVLLPFLLFAIGAFATPGMIGRMVMHALPFYVAHISKLLEKLEPH